MTGTGKIVWPKDAVTFNGEEFEYLFSLAINAGQMTMPVENPENFGVNIEDEEGAIQRYAFTDRAESRAMLAVKKEFNGDSERFSSFMWRFFGLMELVARNKIPAPWVKDLPDGDGKSIHSAVIETTGKHPMDGEGHFEINSFLEAVKIAPSANEPD